VIIVTDFAWVVTRAMVAARTVVSSSLSELRGVQTRSTGPDRRPLRLSLMRRPRLLVTTAGSGTGFDIMERLVRQDECMRAARGHRAAARAAEPPATIPAP
jgi:hypothetical protein